MSFEGFCPSKSVHSEKHITSIKFSYFSILASLPFVSLSSFSRLRKSLNDLANGEYKLSVNDFVVKASALTMKKVPEVNSSWMGDFIRRCVFVCMFVWEVGGTG